MESFVFAVFLFRPFSPPAPFPGVKFLSAAAPHTNHWLIPVQYAEYEIYLYLEMAPFCKRLREKFGSTVSYFKKWEGKGACG